MSVLKHNNLDCHFVIPSNNSPEVLPLSKMQSRFLFWAMIVVGSLLFGTIVGARNIARLERFEKLYGEQRKSDGTENAIDTLISEIRAFSSDNGRWLVDFIKSDGFGERPTTLWLRKRTQGADLHLDGELLDNLQEFAWAQTIKTHRKSKKVEFVLYRPVWKENVRANGFILKGTEEVHALRVIPKSNKYRIEWKKGEKQYWTEIVSLSARSSVPTGEEKYASINGKKSRKRSVSDAGSAVGGTPPTTIEALEKLLVALEGFSSSRSRWIVGLAPQRQEQFTPQVLWQRIQDKRSELFVDDFLVDYVNKGKWERLLTKHHSRDDLQLLVYRHVKNGDLRANGFIIPFSRKVEFLTTKSKGRRHRLDFHDDKGRKAWTEVPSLAAIADVPSGSRKLLKVHYEATNDNDDDTTSPIVENSNPYGVHPKLTAGEIEAIVDRTHRRHAKGDSTLHLNDWGVAVGRTKTAVITHAGGVDGFSNRYACLIAYSKEVRQALAKAAAEKKEKK